MKQPKNKTYYSIKLYFNDEMKTKRFTTKSDIKKYIRVNEIGFEKNKEDKLYYCKFPHEPRLTFKRRSDVVNHIFLEHTFLEYIPEII